MPDVIDLPRFLKHPHEEGVRVCEIPDTDDWDGINQALRQHPSVHFFALAQYRAARTKEQQERWLYEQAARKAYGRLREEGVGVSDAKDARELDPDVVKAYRRVLDSELLTGRWRALVEGLEQKGSALQQISARQREELKKNWMSHRDPPPQE